MVRVSPVTRWPVEWWPPGSARRARSTPAPPRRRVGEEMVLAAGPALGLDDEPWLLAPLNATTVAEVLNVAGFVAEQGERITSSDLVVDGREFAHRSGVAQLDVLVYDGTLRALHLVPIGDDAAQWQRTVGPLHELATEVGARFLPTEEYA